MHSGVFQVLIELFTSADLYGYNAITFRILLECSCLIGFIKRVGKSDNMRGSSSILSLFRNSFNELDNAILFIVLYLIHFKRFFGVERKECQVYVTLLWASFDNVTTSGLYTLMHGNYINPRRKII